MSSNDNERYKEELLEKMTIHMKEIMDNQTRLLSFLSDLKTILLADKQKI